MNRLFLFLSLLFVNFALSQSNIDNSINSNKTNLNFKYNSYTFYTTANLKRIQNLNLSADSLNLIRKSILKNIPTPNSLVCDYAGILNSVQIDSLEQLLFYYDDKYNLQIAVVTILPFMYNDIEKFGTNLFNKWGIGNKETKNGILFLYDFENKKIRITNGFGIEKIYSDKETLAIIDKIIKPLFRESKFFKGIYDASNQMATEVISKKDFIRNSISKLFLIPQSSQIH